MEQMVSGQSASANLSFRMTRLANRSSGRVEVSIGGVWSGVSYKGWTIEAGQVACRMLGFPTAATIFESSRVMGRLGIEWVLVKHCFGNESSLVDCSLNIRDSPLHHPKRSRRSPAVIPDFFLGEAGVVCGQPKVSFRIQGFSGKTSSGRVEVSIDGMWSALSYQGWTLAAGQVACRMFGLPRATSITNSADIMARLGVEWVLLKYCLANESSLVNCSLHIRESPVYYRPGRLPSWWSDSFKGEAGVICGPRKESMYLSGYSSTNNTKGQSMIGEVVLEIEGIPGRIGATSWNNRAAEVVCRMLNMDGPYTAIRVDSYIPAVWLNNVRCSENETNLLDCNHTGLRLTSSWSKALVGCGKPEISFRLTGSHNGQEGNVETYINGVMVFLDINDKNKQNVSTVICRTLDLPPPSMIVQKTKPLHIHHYRTKGFLNIHLACMGNERNVSECKKHIETAFLQTAYLHGVSCRKGYQCPGKCSCNLDSKQVGCINSNLTETMEPLPVFIRVLEIKGYEIHRLKRKYFIKLEGLRELILYRNNLKDIDPWVISKLSMTNIDIQNNTITRLRKHAFIGVAECTSLTLFNNSITVLEPQVFGLLRTLFIEGNNISTLYSGTLFSYRLPEKEIIARLPEIEQASKIIPSVTQHANRMIMSYSSYGNLQRNKISEIQPSAIGGGGSFGNIHPYLDVLILTDNLIKRLDKRMLAGISLQILFLNANPLEVIEEGTFSNSRQLTILNLIDTRLQQISPGILKIAPRTSIKVYKSQSQPIVIECRDNPVPFYNRGYEYHKLSTYSAVCEACALGFYKAGTRTGTCVQCPAGGFYQDEEAQYKILSHGLGCKQCPPGSFVPGEQAPGKDPAECKACPEGTRRNLPAMFRACSCLDDHYRVHRFQKCMPCDEGYQCVNESVNLLPGFYWKWSSIDAKYLYTNFTAQLQVRNNTHNKNLTSYSLGIPKAYACPVVEACKGGLDSQCSDGYEGPLCAVCSKGFYMLASKCRKCPSLPWIIAQVVLIIVIVAGLLIFMIKEKRSKSNKRSLSDAMTARLKIVLGFFQVTSGTISGFSYIKWPDVMISVVRYAELLQMNLLQIAPPQCLSRSLKTDIHVKLVLTMACNCAVVILGLLYYYIKTRCKSRNGEDNESVKSSAQQKCFRAVFLILFISYPVTSSHIFMVLPEACHRICTSTDETTCNYYLKSDYTVRCDSPRFFWFSIFARVLLVYPVGFPLLVLYLLWRHYYQKTDTKKETQDASGIAVGLRFLYENYTDDVWFWEIIELVRKVILTSVILLLDADSRFSIGMTAMICGFYSISFAYFKPMTDVFEHWLQLTSLLATLVNMIAGILLVAQSTGEALDGAMMKVLLMAANMAVVAIMAVRYLIALGQTFLALRRNPRCSLSCCLYLFLTLNEAGNEVAGVGTSSQGLKRQQDLYLDMRQQEVDFSQAGLSVELDEKELWETSRV